MDKLEAQEKHPEALKKAAEVVEKLVPGKDKAAKKEYFAENIAKKKEDK